MTRKGQKNLTKAGKKRKECSPVKKRLLPKNTKRVSKKTFEDLEWAGEEEMEDVCEASEVESMDEDEESGGESEEKTSENITATTEASKLTFSPAKKRNRILSPLKTSQSEETTTQTTTTETTHVSRKTTSWRYCFFKKVAPNIFECLVKGCDHPVVRTQNTGHLGDHLKRHESLLGTIREDAAAGKNVKEDCKKILETHNAKFEKNQKSLDSFTLMNGTRIMTAKTVIITEKIFISVGKRRKKFFSGEQKKFSVPQKIYLQGQTKIKQKIKQNIILYLVLCFFVGAGF